MKDTLSEILSKFGCTKPVFRGVNQSNGTSVSFEALETYDPETADVDLDDPIVKLMISNWNERFNTRTQVFEIINPNSYVATNMCTAIRKAFKNASELKNPVQSKMYKWLCLDSLFDRLEDRETLIMLYRYVYNNVADKSEFRFKDGSDNPHAKNLVAILEKMKQKYERK